jgi:oligopeptide/dipeptide ABC transporter ATP-binding protein
MVSRIKCGASMTDAPGLSIDNLSIAFDAGRKPAVTGVSLRVPMGEAVGLVGESGSGKSLTSRAALGLLPKNTAVSGRVSLDGKSILDMPPAELRRVRGAGIAMIFQDPMSSLNPVARVGQSIAQVIQSHEDVSANAAATRAVGLMDRVGIRDAKARADSFPHEFSGGMRQRIMIAMALAAKPRILVADEPTTALDVIVQKNILNLLDQLRREEGMGLLLVSHDLAVVASMCSRIAVMYAGQIVEEGPAKDILARPRMPYTAGLLASTRRDKSITRLTSIPGSPPPLGDRTASCRFAPRCPLVVDACRVAHVGLVDVGQGHGARCIRTAEAAHG